jgi:hypothetical protein
LHLKDENQPWIDFYDHEDHVSCVPSFSRDGRYCAWGVDRGTVRVADLHVLRDRVQAFEQTVLPK